MKHVLNIAALIVALLWGIKSYAQDVMVATLQHGETSSVFYGRTGFEKAMKAASQGDVITLSAGTFTATTIDKAVTIQGAGYASDVANKKYATVINGDIYVKLPDEMSGLYIEGIYGNSLYVKDNITVATFKKCRFDISFESGKQVKDCLIDQCRMSYCYLVPNCDNFSIRNSIVFSLTGSTLTGIIYVENCTVGLTDDEFVAMLKNNIILRTAVYKGNYQSLHSACLVYNNVFVRGHANAVISQSGNMYADMITLFGKEIKELEYSDTETYQLTSSAQTSYLGVDGKQMGIYGGLVPFTSIPTNPQIISKKIDTQSSAEGKLKVNITVEAQK